MTCRRGLVALGDSITHGEGAPVLGVHAQSWALWLAQALDLPYTNYAVPGHRMADVVREQVPRVRSDFDLGCLYGGVNDARSIDFDAAAFERAAAAVLDVLAGRCARLLVLTLPEDLGRPRAGDDVLTANAALRRLAREREGVVCELADFRGWTLVQPDAVHPTAAGQVAIGQRAAAALGARLDRPEGLGDPGPAYAQWYARRLAADLWRRGVERVRYRAATVSRP